MAQSEKFVTLHVWHLTQALQMHCLLILNIKNILKVSSDLKMLVIITSSKVKKDKPHIEAYHFFWFQHCPCFGKKTCDHTNFEPEDNHV